MKRYSSLIVAAFCLVAVFVIGLIFMESYADETSGRRSGERVTIYTTMPAEQAGMLAAEYESLHKVHVDFVPMAPSELTEKLTDEARTRHFTADAVLADSLVLERAANKGVFVPYMSEAADSVPDEFKSDDAAWTGTWYDPVVFCYNSDYMASLPAVPRTWETFASYPKMRVGMTDFLAADASANVYLSLIAAYGEPKTLALLAAIHPKVVQYVKYLSTPVRMAGMGEVDASIATLSETIRYLGQGYPVHAVYPSDGTAYMLTGVALINENSSGAKAFHEWLLSDEVQLALHSAELYVVPTNQSLLAYKMYAGKDRVLFSKRPDFDDGQKSEMLNEWLKNVRFKD